jgi:hypothetical protein
MLLTNGTAKHADHANGCRRDRVILLRDRITGCTPLVRHAPGSRFVERIPGEVLARKRCKAGSAISQNIAWLFDGWNHGRDRAVNVHFEHLDLALEGTAALCVFCVICGSIFVSDQTVPRSQHRLHSVHR